MDSASAHISAPVLAAFRAAGLSCAVISGGLNSFIQAVDAFLAFLYRTWYLQMAENKKKWTAADARNAFVDLSHRGLKMAKSKIDMSTNFRKLGYINPCDVQLRVPFTFVPPVAPQGAFAQPAAPHVAAKPKPKAAPKQLSMTSFLKPN